MKLDELLGSAISTLKRNFTVPTKFKIGDKFEVENNGLNFTLEVISVRPASDKVQEIEIETVRDGKSRKSFTDSLQLSDRLRDSKSYKKL